MWLFLFLIYSSFAHSDPGIKDSLIRLDKTLHAKPAENCTDFSCHDEDKKGCVGQFESFCKELYSDKNKGNMDVLLPNKETINIRLSKTNERNENSIFEAYNQAKLESKDNLPADFKAELDKKDYFKDLAEYTNLVKQKTVGGIKEDQAKLGDLNYTWRHALDNVVTARTEKVIPGYSSKEVDRLTYQDELTFQRNADQLRVQINSSIWKNNPAWKKIEFEFKNVKGEYIKYLSENKTLSDSTRKKMIEKMKSVELILPGTNINSVDDECAQTENNAYYDSTINKLTVCAGRFSIPGIAVMGHELSHAIDPNILLRDDINNSDVSKHFENYLKQSCSETKPKCEDWINLKKELTNFKADKKPYYSEKYLQCLRQKKLTAWPEKSVLNDITSMDVNSFIDNLARNNVLLALAAPEIRNRSGEKEKNNLYMNICESFGVKYEKFNLNSRLVAGLAYVTEYRCSNQKTDSDKLTAATNEAKALAIQFQNNSLEAENSLTGNSEMIRRGYSSPLGEKVADNIGLNVASRVINKRFKDTETRKKIFFSAGSVHCDGYTLQSDYPSLAVAQKAFSSEPHSQNYNRRRELMTKDIRTVLGCEKDFDMQDCEL
jgi:hypothetical protein